MIIILSYEKDQPAIEIHAAIKQRGISAIIVDSGDFPTRAKIEAHIDCTGLWNGLLIDREGRHINLKEIQSVLYRRPTHYQISKELPEQVRSFADNEASKGFGGILRSLDCFWVSHPDSGPQDTSQGNSERQPCSDLVCLALLLLMIHRRYKTSTMNVKAILSIKPCTVEISEWTISIIKQEHLIAEIEKERVLSEHIRAAFLAVDRAIFVPQFYRHERTQWQLQQTQSEAYTDVPLVTQITNGLPSSSSSKPSIMAAMLEALDVRPGMHVLEIGTGTGYNAALIAHIVGEQGQVTSVDIDSHLVHEAYDHLRAAGISNVVARAYDGHQGYEKHAPYDRIIATAGFRQIPTHWRDQLATNGILVGNLLGPVVTPLILLTKTSRNEMKGSILPTSALFMEMHKGDNAPILQSLDWTPYDEIPAITIQDEELQRDLQDTAFLFLVQGMIATTQLHMRPVTTNERTEIATTIIDTSDQSSVTLLKDSILARGSILSSIKATQKQWQGNNLKDYQLSLNHTGVLSVSFNNRYWTL